MESEGNDDHFLLPPSQLATLAERGWLVVPNFLTPHLQQVLREDVASLRREGRFQVAKIGQDGLVQDTSTPYRDIRYSETSVWQRAEASEAQIAMYAIIDGLRHELDTEPTLKNPGTLTHPLASLDRQLEEVLYAYYPVGGYYRRHRDAEPGSASSWRQYSYLIYLNENTWQPEHGGYLRLHRDTGGDQLPGGELPNFIDIAPEGGTLVVFRSDLIPHEVLTTHIARIAVVGWFLAATEPALQNRSLPTPFRVSHLPESVLTALRQLRSEVPRLASKLEPKPPANQSGLILDDFDFAMTSSTNTAPPPPSYPDTDPRFWRVIAAFDEDGHIATLSLAGQRLRSVSSAALCQSALLDSLRMLDLGSSDVAVETLAQMLAACPATLVQLHVGGCALGDQGLIEVVPFLPKSLQVLDLRYNGVGPAGAAAVSTQFLSQGRCEKLYLEGNQLGDAGVDHLSKNLGVLRELYLGQNGIGHEGASSLARFAIANPLSRLEKLYLEGNSIGSQGAQSIRRVLEGLGAQHQRLDKLYVDNNGIDKDEAIRLGQAVRSATVIGESGFFQD